MNHSGSRLALLLLAVSTAAAADPATLARDTDMRAKPLSDAPVVSALKAQAAVDINERSGAWAHITTATGKSGWVRMLNLRTSSARRGDSGVGALASVFHTGSSGSSVSTGVKGLSEEDLTGATPNHAQVKQLAAWRATPQDARQSAKEAGLKAQPVKYLDGEKIGKKKRHKDED